MVSQSTKILLSVSNDLFSDQRVQKVYKTLAQAGYEVEMVGRLLPRSKELKGSFQYKRLKLWFNKGPLFYTNLNVRLFFYLLNSKAQIFIANDLDTLLANYLASKIKGKSLIYDSHEYFTEVPELIDRPKVQSIWKRLEAYLLPKVKYAYTVSESIAKAYKKEYGISMQIVRNFPICSDQIEVSQEGKQEKIVVYQGALNVKRGLEELILAFQDESLNDCKLWLFGEGDIEKQLKNIVEEMKLKDRVKFFGRISPEDLGSYTKQATLGVSIEHPQGKNYEYALPNKVFDYLHAGVPVLYSPLKEMSKFLDPLNIGESHISHNPKELAGQISSMMKSEQYEKWVENCFKASIEYCWEKEEKVLLKLVEDAKA